jgi:hypothetical protein
LTRSAKNDGTTPSPKNDDHYRHPILSHQTSSDSGIASNDQRHHHYQQQQQLTDTNSAAVAPVAASPASDCVIADDANVVNKTDDATSSNEVL